MRRSIASSARSVDHCSLPVRTSGWRTGGGARLHGADGNAHGLGDFLVREALDIAHDHRGTLVGFSGSIAHSPDIGGSLWSADCRELCEEGLWDLQLLPWASPKASFGRGENPAV